MFTYDHYSNLRCNESIAIGGIVPDIGDVRRLPMFFRCDPDYVYRLGGEPYRAILNSLHFGSEHRFISIDTRIHMMMPGWYPCIPGWHCDDFYRPTGDQPDLVAIRDDLRLQCRHHAVVVGNVAPTEYISRPFVLPLAELDSSAIYRTADAYIEKQVLGVVKTPTFLVGSGRIISFGSFDFHRGTKSSGAGWRLFFRATESDMWEPQNETRTQVQVYLRDAGW